VSNFLLTLDWGPPLRSSDPKPAEPAGKNKLNKIASR